MQKTRLMDTVEAARGQGAADNSPVARAAVGTAPIAHSADVLVARLVGIHMELDSPLALRAAHQLG